MKVLSAIRSTRRAKIWHRCLFTIGLVSESGWSCGEAEIVIKQNDLVVMAVNPLRAVSVVYMVITVEIEGDVGPATLERRSLGSFPESRPSRCHRKE